MSLSSGLYNTTAEWRDGVLCFFNGADSAIGTSGMLRFGVAANTALLLGGGTAASPLTADGASPTFLSFYADNGAASGTARGLRFNLYLTGGAGGEAARFFTINSAAAPADTVNGAHISVQHTGSGNVTGLATAARMTYHVPSANTTGTNAAIQAELYADGANSTFTGNGAFFRAVLDGNATGVGKLDDTADLLRLDGVSIGAGNMVAVKTAAAVSHTIRVRIGGTIYYLMASDTQ